MSATTPTRTSNWIPWLFVGGFLVVLIANGTMLYFALQSWTGIETEAAYEKGLAFNEQIETAEAQARLGWTAELTVTPSGERQAEITLVLLDSAGAPLERAEVTGLLRRPTQAGLDQSLTLSPAGNGRYSTEAALPLAGQWELKLEVQHRRGEYRIAKRIELP